jgi:hypothetical protein
VPPDALSTVRTNAVSDATPTGRQGSLPFVVLSPGFEQHLRDRPQALLDQPSSRYPEVTFCF